MLCAKKGSLQAGLPSQQYRRSGIFALSIFRDDFQRTICRRGGGAREQNFNLIESSATKRCISLIKLALRLAASARRFRRRLHGNHIDLIGAFAGDGNHCALRVAVAVLRNSQQRGRSRLYAIPNCSRRPAGADAAPSA
jgi:hypothetical protein